MSWELITLVPACFARRGYTPLTNLTQYVLWSLGLLSTLASVLLLMQNEQKRKLKNRKESPLEIKLGISSQKLLLVLYSKNSL